MKGKLKQKNISRHVHFTQHTFKGHLAPVEHQTVDQNSSGPFLVWPFITETTSTRKTKLFLILYWNPVHLTNKKKQKICAPMFSIKAKTTKQ